VKGRDYPTRKALANTGTFLKGSEKESLVPESVSALRNASLFQRLSKKTEQDGMIMEREKAAM